MPWARRCAWLFSAMAFMCSMSAIAAFLKGSSPHGGKVAFSLLGVAAALWFRRQFAAYVRHGLALAAGDARGLEGALRVHRSFFRGFGLAFLIMFLVMIVLGVVAGRGM